MALNGIPISDDQCIGDSLVTINNAFVSLDASVLTLSSTVNSLSASGSASITSLSSTVDTNFALKSTITSLSSTVDTNFIPKPASASAQQVLTYNGSTTTWVASAAPNGSTGPTSAKAWVNFNGSSYAVIDSFNFSSVTYLGTFQGAPLYRLNYTNSIASGASCCMVGTAGPSSDTLGLIVCQAKTTTYVEVTNRRSDNTGSPIYTSNNVVVFAS